MTGLIIGVIVLVLVAVVRKAAKDSAAKGPAPMARMHYGLERVKQWASPPQMPPAMRPAPLTSTGQYGPPAPDVGSSAVEWRQPAPPQRQEPFDPLRQRQRPPQSDIDARVRELMDSGNEVAAVRLLCDELTLGIIEAQEYARALAGAQAAERNDAARRDRELDLDFIGSAAIATSTFEVDRDTDWVDRRALDPAADRAAMEELWRTLDEQRIRQQEDDEAGTTADGSEFEADLQAEHIRLEPDR